MNRAFEKKEWGIITVAIKLEKNKQNPLSALGAVAPCTNCH